MEPAGQDQAGGDDGGADEDVDSSASPSSGGPGRSGEAPSLAPDVDAAPRDPEAVAPSDGDVGVGSGPRLRDARSLLEFLIGAGATAPQGGKR